LQSFHHSASQIESNLLILFIVFFFDFLLNQLTFV